MAKRYVYSFTVDIDHRAVWSLASDPTKLIPLWPYLQDIENIWENGARISMLFRRFGVFSMKVDFNVSLEVDEGSRTAKYVSRDKDKEFILIIKVSGYFRGALVTMELEYSGPYSGLSEPLLKNFAKELANRIREAARVITLPPPPSPETASPTTPPPTVSPRPTVTGPLIRPGIRRMPKIETTEGPSLSDFALMTKIIREGKVIGSGKKMVSDRYDAAVLVKSILDETRDKTIVVRLTPRGREGEVLARILAVNGKISDIMIESSGNAEFGVDLLDRLLDLLEGSEVEYIVVEVPRE